MSSAKVIGVSMVAMNEAFQYLRLLDRLIYRDDPETADAIEVAAYHAKQYIEIAVGAYREAHKLVAEPVKSETKKKGTK